MKNRIPQLDGLRALCILAVFATHAFHVRMLWMGVDVFFILSGFLITGILVDARDTSFRKYLGHFYDRRARRILPPYLMVLLVASLIFGTAWMARWYMYLGLTNYVNFFPTATMFQFNALWSLGVEEQFYLVWPLVIFFLPRRAIPWMAVALIFLAPCLRAALTPVVAHRQWNSFHWFIYQCTLTRMDELSMGALLTFAWRSHTDTVKRYGWLGLLLFFATPPVMLYLSHLGGFSTVDDTIRGNVVTYEIALAASTGVFLWALGGRFVSLLTLPPMRYLGRISYTFYLIHQSMLRVAPRFFHNRWTIAAAAFIAAFLYSALSWEWLEKRILHSGNRKVARQETAAAQPHAASHEAL